MKNCIFISAGDRERFVTECINDSPINTDLIVNFYGDDKNKLEKFKRRCTHLTQIKSTKFVALKKIYEDLIENKYQWVAVFDDDAKLISGSINDLISKADKYKLDIVSGSHSGKISHPIHCQQLDNEIRYVNFVEMNFPIFRERALSKYIKIYDGELCGWGNDWWYCHVLGTQLNYNAGIVDSVCIENPLTNGEMDGFMSAKNREEQWEKTMERYSLKQWKQKTLKVVNQL